MDLVDGVIYGILDSNPLPSVLGPRSGVVELRSSRRKNTFDGKHLWRRNERRAIPRWRDDGDKKPIELTSLSNFIGQHDIIESYQSRLNRIQHTNEILDYFGFRDGEERASLLKSFNGEYHYGANIVRTAYHIASFYGLKGNNFETAQQTKDIFAAIANSIHKNGTPNTNLLINSFGLISLPVITLRDYSPLELDEKVHLVPRGDLESITTRLASASLPTTTKPKLEHLGYVLREISGLPFYVRSFYIA